MGIYEYLCGPVHVQMCLCTHVVWRPGHSHGYHLQELHLLWGVFHWPGTHQLITCQAGEPQGPSCLYLPSAAITSTCCYSGILCDLVDSSGSKACKGNTSPTDYFPQSTIDSNFFFLSSVLGTEPMTLCVLGNCLPTELRLSPVCFSWRKICFMVSEIILHWLKRQSSPSTKNLRCASLFSRQLLCIVVGLDLCFLRVSCPDLECFGFLWKYIFIF